VEEVKEEMGGDDKKLKSVEEKEKVNYSKSGKLTDSL
jgi:hypothetical protein